MTVAHGRTPAYAATDGSSPTGAEASGTLRPKPSKEPSFAIRVRSSPRLDSQRALPLERRKRSFVAVLDRATTLASAEPGQSSPARPIGLACPPWPLPSSWLVEHDHPPDCPSGTSPLPRSKRPAPRLRVQSSVHEAKCGGALPAPRPPTPSDARAEPGQTSFPPRTAPGCFDLPPATDTPRLTRLT